MTKSLKLVETQKICKNRSGANRRKNYGCRRWPEYDVWNQIRKACQNPRNSRWHLCGAKGIKVCPQWQTSFVTFILDMGRRPSDEHILVRIDTNKDYAPGNVYWKLTKGYYIREVFENILTLCGETHTVLEWACLLGITYVTAYKRLENGWPIGDVLKINRNLIKECIVPDVIDLYVKGKHFSEIAKMLRVSLIHVDRIIRAWKKEKGS